MPLSTATGGSKAVDSVSVTLERFPIYVICSLVLSLYAHKYVLRNLRYLRTCNQVKTLEVRAINT